MIRHVPSPRDAGLPVGDIRYALWPLLNPVDPVNPVDKFVIKFDRIYRMNRMKLGDNMRRKKMKGHARR